jgi:hypothetical protein
MYLNGCGHTAPWRLQTGRSHVALLVQPPLPRHPEEASGKKEEVHLTVRAESGSEADHAKVVAYHSDPHDPWHQVTAVRHIATLTCIAAADQQQGVVVQARSNACMHKCRWCEQPTAQAWGRDSR